MYKRQDNTAPPGGTPIRDVHHQPMTALPKGRQRRQCPLQIQRRGHQHRTVRPAQRRTLQSAQRHTYYEGGNCVAQLSLATTEKGYTLQNGTQIPDRTEWHNLIFRGRLGEIVEKYVHKGEMCIRDRVNGLLGYYIDNVFILSKIIVAVLVAFFWNYHLQRFFVYRNHNICLLYTSTFSGL